MHAPTRTTHRVAAALATPVAVPAAATLVWHASYAASSGTTRSSGNSWSTGTVALTAPFRVAHTIRTATVRVHSSWRSEWCVVGPASTGSVGPRLTHTAHEHWHGGALQILGEKEPSFTLDTNRGD
jgi:hypothetical protein